jgi:hypothetical protein
MPRADSLRSAQKTKLARLRVLRDYSQRDLELGSGVPIRTLQRLEAGQIESPPFGYLVNLTVAPESAVEDLIEDGWLAAQSSPYTGPWAGPDFPGGIAGRLQQLSRNRSLGSSPAMCARYGFADSSSESLAKTLGYAVGHADAARCRGEAADLLPSSQDGFAPGRACRWRVCASTSPDLLGASASCSSS